MGVVLVGEGHVVAIESEQPVIADRHAMGIASEVPQDGCSATEGRLGVYHPVGVEERVDEGPPRCRIPQVLAAAGQVELVAVVRASYLSKKLPAKDTTEALHGEEEARVRGMNPAGVIGRQPARRHHAVDVGMTNQRLSPRVEDAQYTDLGAEMARMSRNLAERRRTRLKEPRVQTRAVPIGQRQEPMREREDDMNIGHVEELALARVEPALPRLRLALWAVPISA